MSRSFASFFAVQHAEGWWVIKQVPRDHASGVDRDQQVEAVAPCMRVGQERESHPGCKRARGSRHEVAVGVGNVSPLHRDNLCDDPEERLLEADSDPDEDLADNESVYILGAGSDDAANESDRGANDEEPSPSENIRQLANHKEGDGSQHQVRESHPEDIWGRANVLIDLR